MFGWFKPKFFQPRLRARFPKLGMGFVNYYSLIVRKHHASNYLQDGWQEAPGFYDFLYAANFPETILLRKPETLKETSLESMTGSVVVDFSDCYGTYGMGGPGFFGLLLHEHRLYQPKRALVYAVPCAECYILMDNRVLYSPPEQTEALNPWCQNDYADFSRVLIGLTVKSIRLEDQRMEMVLSGKDRDHVLEFVKNDSRLAPQNNGLRASDAFKTGVIGDYLLFQLERAVLHMG